MFVLSVIILVAAFARFCDAYAHAPAHVGGLAADNLPRFPYHGLFSRNDTNSSKTSGTYKLLDLYDYTNFFDKFSFVVSQTGTDEYTDVDPTHGFVLYQNRSEAERMGLAQVVDDGVAIMVDYKTVIDDPLGYGRKSVRIESTASYNHSLVIADFWHLPKAQCGTWPAFWMYGPHWPKSGEMDIYEQWNDYKFNRQTLHTDHNATTGNCTYDMESSLGYHSFDMTNYKRTETCDVYASNNDGCTSWDYEGPYGSQRGGVYAMEWTSDYIRMWTWHPHEVPLDVQQDAPDPQGWGLPGLSVGGSFCDVDRAFTNQSIVLNIDFCGDTAGSGSDWTESCAEKTGYNICARYVAAEPGDFEESWFGVTTIKVYTLQ
ncbi:beta-1,3-endoglucanase [Diaporthe helianthi]|uniref:Beta-1,3-endoglucanase n=1 Tax=Diaporthe helianthi TaxID=158607 RepID=A0A2P5HYB9_DIAHE|nr:beta-1,3-endoglucanase [Diaporthe helianthi]